MEHFVYPAIFYFDKEYNNYAVAFPDVNIYTDGDTIEEAYKNAQKYLLSYIECCYELGQSPDKPSEYQTVVEDNKGQIVMLVAVDYEAGKKEKEISINSDIFEDVDDTYMGSDKSRDELIEKKLEQSKNSGDDGGDDDFSLPPL